MSPLKKILHVEDEVDIQVVTRLALEAVGGFTVQSCSSGPEALIKAPEFMPDLILLDVMMPGMDGPTTLKEHRKLPEMETTPIVFMTAKIMQTEVDVYERLGAIGMISKSFIQWT